MKIVPYSPEYEKDINLLDAESIQGGVVKIRMNKPAIHSRAEAFEDHHTILAKVDDEIAGYMSGAKTLLTINNLEHEVFVGFDAKVKAGHRNKGVFKTLTTNLMDYYSRKGVQHAMITTKANNKSINSIVRKQFVRCWSRKFMYLTLPTSGRVKKIKSGSARKLSIEYHQQGRAQVQEFCRCFKGFNIFNTYKLYQLQILEIPYFLEKLVQGANWFYGKQRYPTPDRPMKIASLYNIQNLQLNEFNSAMEKLQSEGIEYLNVCCCEGDSVYNTLKPLTISRYPYYLVSTLEMDPEDKIKIDVRCL